jgi:copper chaperone CopZ
MKHLTALLLALGTATLVACESSEQAHSRVEEANTVSLAITGLPCGVGCPPRVRSALESVDGVESVEVDYSRKTATVHCSSGGCDTAALIAALERADYGASVR